MEKGEGEYGSNPHIIMRGETIIFICALINSVSGRLRPCVSLPFGVFLFFGHLAAPQHGHQRAERDVKTKSDKPIITANPPECLLRCVNSGAGCLACIISCNAECMGTDTGGGEVQKYVLAHQSSFYPSKSGGIKRLQSQRSLQA